MQKSETHSPKRRLTILLAEDNPVNQQLARAMLEKAGHDVTIVENGRLAVEAMAEKDFDVILIDVQMPVMDGLEAVAAIRRREKTTGTHRLIVALTAHAMKGDREKCLDVGMDAHVSKPLRRQELLSVLDELALDRRPDPSGGAERPPALDIERLMEHVEGDRDLLAEIVGIYLEGASELVERIREGVRRGDALEVEHAAHRLKGSLVSLAAFPTSEWAQEVESSGRAERLDDAAEAFESLEGALSELEEGLSVFATEA